MKKYRIRLVVAAVFILAGATVGWQAYGALGDSPAQGRRLFKHIRTFCILYISPADPRWAAHSDWPAEHCDLAIVQPTGLPKTTSSQVSYLNFSDLAENRPLYDGVNNRMGSSSSFDDIFYHFRQDKNLTIREHQTQKEDRFQHVVLGSGSSLQESMQDESLTDITAQTYGDTRDHLAPEHPVTTDLAIAPAKGDALYIGHPWPFAEINFNVHARPSRSWRATPEYWDGKKWTGLILMQDETAALTRSGQVRFTPPRSWQRRSFHGNLHYWVRWRCTAAGPGSKGPILRSVESFADSYHWSGISAIRGAQYTRKSPPNQWVQPGWNPANDRNGDGYVDDQEFSQRIDPQASARFRYQSRVPAAYLTGRWMARLDNADYQKVIQDEISTTLKTFPNDNGVFIDNCERSMHDVFSGKGLYSESPGAPPDLLANIQSVTKETRRRIVSGAVLPNQNQIWINSTPNHYEDHSVNGMLWETDLGWVRSPLEYEEYLKHYTQDLDANCAGGQSVLLLGRPDFRLSTSTAVTLAADQIYALARYYLTANACTYFSYQDGRNYATPWENWFGAIEANIGEPNGHWFTSKGWPKDIRVEGMLPPSNLFGRRYTNGIVLLKTRYQEDLKLITLQLPEDYLPLAADGKVGPKTRSVTIGNYQGLVLLKACGDVPCIPKETR